MPRIDYYYKPKNTYPARIYVLIHAENWQRRNMRAMGIMNQSSFLRRNMTEDEVKENEKNWRMRYIQYESFSGLVADEIAVLGEEHDFIKQLLEFQNKFNGL